MFRERDIRQMAQWWLIVPCAPTIKTTNISRLEDAVCLAQASTCVGRTETGVGLPMVHLRPLSEKVYHGTFLPVQTFPPGRSEAVHDTLKVNFTYLGAETYPVDKDSLLFFLRKTK